MAQPPRARQLCRQCRRRVAQTNLRTPLLRRRRSGPTWRELPSRFASLVPPYTTLRGRYGPPTNDTRAPERRHEEIMTSKLLRGLYTTARGKSRNVPPWKRRQRTVSLVIREGVAATIATRRDARRSTSTRTVYWPPSATNSNSRGLRTMIRSLPTPCAVLALAGLCVTVGSSRGVSGPLVAAEL